MQRSEEQLNIAHTSSAFLNFEAGIILMNLSGVSLMKKSNGKQLLEAFSLVGTIGLNTVATVAAGLFVGRLADNYWDISPWATVAGVVLGMITGMWTTYKRVRETEGGD